MHISAVVFSETKLEIFTVITERLGFVNSRCHPEQSMTSCLHCWDGIDRLSITKRFIVYQGIGCWGWQRDEGLAVGTGRREPRKTLGNSCLDNLIR